MIVKPTQMNFETKKIAMIIAGLMADGTTEITDIYHIDRGYENFEEKFVQLGGDIQRVQVVDDMID